MEHPKYEKRGIISMKWHEWKLEEYLQILRAEMVKMGYDHETWDILQKRDKSNDG